MKHSRILLIFLILAVCGTPAGANAQTAFDFNSIVKLRAFVPAQARTAGSLGTEREGTGVVIDASGHILTIGYLILEAESIEVIGPEGKPRVAAFVGYDHATGFGLIKVDSPMATVPIEIGHSGRIAVGDAILLVGHDGPDSVTPAKIIARELFVGYWEYLLDDAFYVAPAHPQFSGMAMLDAQGRLIGIGSILTQMVIPQYGLVACNMFVPIDLLKPILPDLIRKGRVASPPKPWLGLNANGSRGRVFIDRVYADSPAHRAGLQKNDIILEVNQKPVKDLAGFYRDVWALGDAGVEVPLTVLQGNRIKDVIVRSADRYQYLHIKPTRKATPAITEKSI